MSKWNQIKYTAIQQQQNGANNQPNICIDIQCKRLFIKWIEFRVISVKNLLFVHGSCDDV